MIRAVSDGGRSGLASLVASVLAQNGGDAWDTVAERPDLFAEASFIGLGGNSIQAITLAAMASEQMGVTLELSVLLSDTPLATVLAKALDAHAAGAPPGTGRPASGPGPAAGAELSGVAELSGAQHAMWMREQIVGPLPYNLVFTCFVDGPLDTGLLTDALHGTVQRHEGLRTVFTEAGGRLERRVLESYRPPVRQYPHQGSPDEFSTHARALAADTGRERFDLGSAPPVRFVLTSHGPDRHALIMAVHHILLDGWAIGLVLREVFARYDALARGQAPGWGPAVRFEEQLEWLDRLRRSGELERQASFWRRHLEGVPTVLDLPADRARSAFQEPDGARCAFDLGPTVSAAVRGRARRLGITPAAFLLAAFALTLSRYTGAQTLLVGMPVAGRPTLRLAELVATTANLVPVRIDVDEDQTVAAFLATVQESLARSLDHAALPFGEVASGAGVTGTVERHPLVQVALGMHAGLIPQRLRSGDLTVRVEEGHGGGAQFDLQLFIRQDSPSFAGDLEYATSVWHALEAAGFCADLAATVEGLTAAPSAALHSVSCLAPQRRALLDRVNETVRPHPMTSVDEEFRAQARRTPDAIALRDATGTTLTYAELERAASAQARLLADAGAGPGGTVLVTTGRSVAEVVAVLGALWSGAAYVGLEPATPAARVSQIVSILGPAAVLGGGVAARHAVPRVPAWPDLPPAALPAVRPDPSRPAYVAFTSGSTGIPKGVCVPHRGVLRLVAGLPDYAAIGPADRVMRFVSLSFDVSTFEIWGALLTGASLEIPPAGVPSAAELGRFVRAAQVTVAWFTSGLFNVVCDFALDDLGGIRHLLTGGDVVSPEHVRRVLRRHPGMAVINGYGPTENTTFSTIHRVTDPVDVEDPLPIGVPVANTQVYVLDARGRPVPPGAVGELYVGGDGIAAGYFGDGEQTACSFGVLSPHVPSRLYRTGDVVRLDTKGRLRFLGRRDDQVKIRGNRVELGELRSVLVTHPQVVDAFVTVTGDGGARQLVAAYVPADGGPTVPDLIGFLAARLPGFMIPVLWAVLPELPLAVTGKVDREAVRRWARPAAAYGAAV
jgi:amino acid adenylation domain-containing protein